MSSKFYLIRTVLIADILPFVVGLTLSWSSPMLPKLQSSSADNPLGMIDETEASWIGSMLSLGAAVGPFAAAIGSEKIGRKWTILLLGLPFLINYIALAFATEVWIYYLFRFLAGFGMGGVFGVVPTYIAEVSDDAIRGTMGSTMNNMIVFGLLISYVIGPYTSITWFNLICAIFALLFVIGFGLLCPDTPQSFLSKGNVTECREVLEKLRGTDNVDKEMERISESIANNGGGGFKDLFNKRSNVKALIISMGLVALQQFSGINVVLFYTQTIFEDAGSSIKPELSAIIIGVVQFTATFITPIFVDRLGRKILLIVSAIFMAVGDFALGAYFYLNEHSDASSLSWLPIASIIVYVIAYNFGFGPLPWTISAELFPPNVKSIGTSVTSSFCWIISFFLTNYFSALSDSIGIYGSFWIFGCFNVIAFLFSLIVVKETKGKTMAEIQEMLSL